MRSSSSEEGSVSGVEIGMFMVEAVEVGWAGASVSVHRKRREVVGGVSYRAFFPALSWVSHSCFT